jgi:hypothetical protein
MFRTVPLSIIRSFSLYTQQWYVSYSLQYQDVPFWSCSQAVSRPVCHIPLLCVQWKTPDDGQRNCPKHVELHFKNKFEKLVHPVGFIVRNLTRCTVTWTSNSTLKYATARIFKTADTLILFYLLVCWELPQWIACLLRHKNLRNVLIYDICVYFQ